MQNDIRRITVSYADELSVSMGTLDEQGMPIVPLISHTFSNEPTLPPCAAPGQHSSAPRSQPPLF